MDVSRAGTAFPLPVSGVCPVSFPFPVSTSSGGTDGNCPAASGGAVGTTQPFPAGGLKQAPPFPAEPIKSSAFQRGKRKQSRPAVRWDRIGKILRCHPAWRTSARPLCAYQHMPALFTGGRPGAHTQAFRPFRLPSEGHSAPGFPPPSHHRRLAWETLPEPTYPSSSVSRSITRETGLVKRKFSVRQKISTGDRI